MRLINLLRSIPLCCRAPKRAGKVLETGRKSLGRLALVTLLLTPAAGNAQTINGVEGLGTLRLDEVVFPGTHNSGSGFRGVLYDYNGGPCGSELYRNQMYSFYEQLDAGIRYFDIDTMYLAPNNRSGWWADKNGYGIWTGHSNCYAGSVGEAMDQIISWMEANRNEVVVVHFNNNVYEKEFEKVALGINKLLEYFFDPNRTSLRIGTKVGRSWPLLADAVRNNNRIFIFVRSDLHDKFPSGSFAKAHTIRETSAIVANAYSEKWAAIDSKTRDVLLENAKETWTNSPFVRMSLFPGGGLFMSNLTGYSNNHYAEAMELADETRRGLTTPRVVNFPLVNLVGTGGEGFGKNDIFEISRRLNKKKLGRLDSIPPITNSSVEYEVSIDCSHSDLNETKTTSRITVEFLADGDLLGRRSIDGVSGCGRWAYFTLSSSRFLTDIVVKTDGDDAFFIDELYIEAGGYTLEHYGRKDGNGWCLSTVEDDADSWKDNMAYRRCFENRPFEVPHWAAVTLDCAVDGIENVETRDEITVSFYSEDGGYLGAKSSSGIDTCALPTRFEFSSTEEVARAEVSTDGTDGYMIDRAMLEARGFRRTSGRDNAVGWCLSQDETDATRSWKGHAADDICEESHTFDF